MGFRYIPQDLIRRSDFYAWFQTSPEKTQRDIEEKVERFVQENPS